MLCIYVLRIDVGPPRSQPPSHTLSVLVMAQFSNVIVHGTINSAQGDLHINNRDSEAGMS